MLVHPTTQGVWIHEKNIFKSMEIHVHCSGQLLPYEDNGVRPVRASGPCLLAMKSK